MSYVPIVRMNIENYGCIQNASFHLTPLHALIGPNDSGKSTTLRAIQTIMQAASLGFGNTSLLPKSEFRLSIEFGNGVQYRFSIGKTIDELLKHGQTELASRSQTFQPNGGTPSFTSGQSVKRIGSHNDLEERFYALFSRPTMIRFDPDFLRKPAALIPDQQGIAFADERGAGLSSVFDAIVNRDTDAFMAIQSDVRAMFPSVAKIGLINVSNSMKEIAATLVDGTRVGAKDLSEGLLYYLGFSALRYLDNTKLFLVEEPENGLHPARIAEVMRSLREISKTSQVIIATHSPLVVNELQGNEVSVVTRTSETGTRAVLLKDVPGFEDAAKVYQPGEFWVSYCDGDQETPLLTGTART